MPTRLSGQSESLFKPGNVDDFMSDVLARNQALAERSAVVQDIFAKQEQDAAAIINAQQSQGDNSQIVLAAKELAGLDAQQKTQEFATKLGINPGANSEILDKIAEEWKSSKLDAIEKRKKLKDDLEVKFFDHPVDYVVAQVKMEGTIKEAEAAAARSGAAMKDMADIQNLTQQIPMQMNALAQSKSAATVQATLEGARAMVDEKIAGQKIANAGININRINALNNMDQQQLSNLSTAISVRFQANSEARQAQQFEFQKEQFAQTKKIQDAQLGEMLAKAADRKEDRDQLTGMANITRIGAAALGINLDKDAFPDTKIIQLLRSKDPKFNDFYSSGLNSESRGKPVISDDAGMAAKVIVEHNATLRPEQKTIGTLLRDSFQAAATPSNAVKGGYDINKKDQVVGAARNNAIKSAIEQQGDIKPGDNSNIYAPPPLQSVLDTKGVKETTWYQKVMAPQMVADGLKEFNSEQLVAMTASAIKSKKITFDEGMKGLKNTFGGAVLLNNASKNYSGFGLPEQGSFNTKINDGAGIPRKYNMMLDQDITRAVTNQLSTFQNSAGTVLSARPFD